MALTTPYLIRSWITPLQEASDGRLQDSAVQRSNNAKRSVDLYQRRFRSYSRSPVEFLVVEELEELASMDAEERQEPLL